MRWGDNGSVCAGGDEVGVVGGGVGLDTSLINTSTILCLDCLHGPPGLSNFRDDLSLIAANAN